MKLNYCTLFDSYYLTRGLSMYYSLERHCSDFHLYIFAFDDQSFNILKKLELKHATIISLSEFEDDELLRIKPSRTRAEYCWTCTSSTIKYVLEKYKVDHCTYIDADIFFYSSPEVLYQEMGNKSVLITEHRYSKPYVKALRAGKYCVQYVTFKNNKQGMTVLNWWRNACIDWCYSRYEDGKFGDQKYLDDWTTRFEGVHELQHLGGGVAPWNVQQYILNKNTNTISGTEIITGNKFALIFYHFHYLRIMAKDFDMGWYKLNKEVVETLYKPYISELLESLKIIQKIAPDFSVATAKFSNETIKDKIKMLIKITTRLNLYKIKTLTK